jgi:hypothetical protein
MTETVAVSDRQALGRLWLPWYVRTDDPTRVVQNIAAEVEFARSVTVQQMADDPGSQPHPAAPAPRSCA